MAPRPGIPHQAALCPLSLLAASYRYSPKSAVRTASGGQSFVDRHSLHDTPCPPHVGCNGCGMVAIPEGDRCGAVADAAVPGERGPDRVVDLRR
jgi:hypothetical protein